MLSQENPANSIRILITTLPPTTLGPPSSRVPQLRQEAPGLDKILDRSFCREESLSLVPTLEQGS